MRGRSSPARADRHLVAHQTDKRRVVAVMHTCRSRTLLDEHFRVEGRRAWFETSDEMQAVLDTYLDGRSHRRPHQGRGMNGRTPAQAFKEGLPQSQPTTGAKTPAAKAA